MRNRARTRDQRGQALVEMALASLMFFFLFFGVIEVSRALYTYGTIVQATRAAARWAVVNKDADPYSGTKNYVVYGNASGTGSQILSGLTTANVEVAPKNFGVGHQGILVRIKNYQFVPVLPVFGGITLPPFETSLYAESRGCELNTPPCV